MSEIRANTVSNAAGTGPATLTGQSAAKAWAYLSESSGSYPIADSFNVSSITDGGVGLITLNFTNDMASSAFSAVGTTTGSTIILGTDTFTAGNFRSVLRAVGGSLVDRSFSNTVHGDLA